MIAFKREKKSLPLMSISCSGWSTEAIKVYFEVKNPLQISLSVSSMSLLCEISAKPTVEGGILP